MNLFKKLFRRASDPQPSPSPAPAAEQPEDLLPPPEEPEEAVAVELAPAALPSDLNTAHSALSASPEPDAAADEPEAPEPVPQQPQPDPVPEDTVLVSHNAKEIYAPFPPFSRLDLSSKRELVAFRDYVVLAMETTGLVAGRDHILELAMERYEGGRLVGRFQGLVLQDSPLSPQVTQLTGLTDADMARQAIPPMEAAQRAAAFIGSAPLVFHNASFVIPFLERLLAMAGVAGPVAYVDSLRLARRAWPEYKTYSLDYLIRRQNLAKRQPHRARGDAMCLSALFRLILTQLGRSGRETKLSEQFQPRAGVVPDQAGPLWQKRIVFAGVFQSGKAAMQMAVDAGALLRETVSAKTDFLVLTPSAADGAKARAAAALNQAGKAHITFLDEASFLRMVRQ